MLANIHHEDVLFLDIETVPQQSCFEDLDDGFRHLWEKKSANFRKPEESASDIYCRAGIYAEFGKIVCISTGIIYHQQNECQFRVKSFYSENEKELLVEFRNMLDNFSSRKNILLCAHNGKEFDFPFIARRMLINQVRLPAPLVVAGKKPWEVCFIDTMELWRFGDYKNYTSLELLAKVFDIPTPKDDIDGSMVADVYWKDHDLKRIVTYCEKDVLTIAQLFLRYKGEPLISENFVQSVTTFQD